MKVFLTSAYPYGLNNYTPEYLKESAQQDPFRVHTVVDTPEEADIIIFAESHPDYDPYLFRILSNPIYKKQKNKCFVYQDYDTLVPLLPTVTPSLELTKYNPVFTQPFCYIIQIIPNDSIRQKAAVPTEKQLLFSFIGAVRTHPVRKKIINLTHEKGFLQDTSSKNAWELQGAARIEYQKIYAGICFDSKFILCPRGIGPNSYRLYESMEMGIAPVIISDEWVPTPGPEWEKFAIRIAESEVDRIPEILAQREPEAAKMGELARQAWLDWFAKDKQFHNLVEACLRMQEQRKHMTHKVYLANYLRFLEPGHLRSLLRFLRNEVKNKLLPKK